MLTRTNQVPEVTLIKGTKIYKNVSVLSAYCPKCKTSYFVDHETHGPPNDRLKTYLNDAVYLKVGQSTYVDRVFSNAVVNGIFSFHASNAAYAEFWTNSYGKAYSIKVPRCQMWQTFTQESIRVVSQELEIIFEAPNNTSISELTYRAYDSLGEKGGIRLSDGHACSECTQDYKAIADWVPQNNDPAALLGVDDNGPVPALVHGNLDVPNIPIQAPNAGPNATQSPVKMVVMDGIVMGPVHCAALNCTADVINARGEAFCATYVTLYAKKCCIVGCGHIKVEDTQACHLHQSEWIRHKQSRTKSTLAGFCRSLNYQGENFLGMKELNVKSSHMIMERHQKLSQKTILALLDFIVLKQSVLHVGLLLHGKNLLNQNQKFLAQTFPNKETRPDYVCIDKACTVLKTSLANGSWEEWKDTTRLIVDAYHYTNHRVADFLCRTYCNPAPLDGSAPNLVIEAEAKDGTKYLKRAFNTQASEELNK